jgi:hypothetical protein
MKRTFYYLLIVSIACIIGCKPQKDKDTDAFITLTKEQLKDKIKGAWAVQTIGVTYGGPTEFRYKKQIIPDSIEIVWYDTMMYHWMKHIPGLYDDIYMDLTFVEVMEKEGIDAPATSHGKAYANAEYMLWHANQQGRYNILNGIEPPESGHWLNNPHADDIDFQIEADFAGIMAPGMPNTAAEICDRVGHIMNYGDGYYGGVLVAGMYSYAFVEDDVKEIVVKALSMIPENTTYYKCINDVIDWHEEYPDDWKKVWQLIEDKWGEDIGCPDGVLSDFNIDAKLNSAYVVLGMLYGDGDLKKTMDISTRAGQDSDCNPATAGGILGTMMGYSNIPEYWSAGLEYIEDMDFKYTTMSLNDVYDISYRHALELIEKGGGSISDESVKIKVQDVKPVAYEQSFPGYQIGERRDIEGQMVLSEKSELEVEFEGVGVVLTGRIFNSAKMDVWFLMNEEETLNWYKADVDFYIDGEFVKNMPLPLFYTERALEIFYQYELSPGEHTLKMVVKNPIEDVVIELGDLITYTKN